MSISFQQFAFKKRPSVYVIESDSSDDDSENVTKYAQHDLQCNDKSLTNGAIDVSTDDTDDGIINIEDDKDTVASDSSMPDFTPVKRKVRSESDGQESDEDVSPLKPSFKRKRIQIYDSDDEDVSTNDDCIIVSDEKVAEPIKDDCTPEIKRSCNQTLFTFINECSSYELIAVNGMSESKVKKIISARPFTDWDNMVEKISAIKSIWLNEFLESCQSSMKERENFQKTIDECESISKKIQKQIFDVACIGDSLPVQPPACLNTSLQLKDFQLIGLNWLVALSEHNINGILADQMGLGKTVQTLAFIGHLLENGQNGPHLIVCPTSTLDNWAREIQTWLPEVSYIEYKGSQQERFFLSKEILYDPDQYGIIVTTINLLSSTKEDRKFFKRLSIQYLVLDEAHMFKNVNSERYKHLLRLNVKSKLLLTGTPLQNNVNELLALLSFLMPDVFQDTLSHMKNMFSKQSKEMGGSLFEKNQVGKLKKILEPFVLRRLKANVLNDLPKKVDFMKKCNMVESQKNLYESIFNEGKSNASTDASKMAFLMKLRKTANHPLLMRQLYTSEKLRNMATKYCNNPLHSECDVDRVYEDMEVMSDFELHTLCARDGFMKEFLLDTQLICNSGKFEYLDNLLPQLKTKGDRVLIFSQFVIMLNILEVYLKHRNYKYTRFDGSTKGTDRQAIIDKFNNDEELFIFLLSTKAGGVGINLTSANVVILHDLDFNPYNDKQAEDRCHRVGQKREVSVYKLVSENTVDEQIYKCGQVKLNLEKELVDAEDVDSNEESNCKLVMQLVSEDWSHT